MADKHTSWRKDKLTSGQRGYNYRWQQARVAFLRANPLCVMCAAMTQPKVTAASVVDHIVPHRGDQELFWQRSNWQSLCAKCHDTTKAELEGRHAAKSTFDASGRVVW